MKFYLKLRRIIRDGEKLQAEHDGLNELIKKVHRQKEHILTFIKYRDAPHQNNYGEDIIKKGVVKRKISSGACPPKVPGSMHTIDRHDMSIKRHFLSPIS